MQIKINFVAQACELVQIACSSVEARRREKISLSQCLCLGKYVACRNYIFCLL